jgi:predicted metal-binding protein
VRRRKPNRSGAAPVLHPEARWSARVTLRDLTSDDSNSASLAADDANVAAARATATTIYVCMTCRAGVDLDHRPIPGAVFAEATKLAAAGTGITVLGVKCLANCSRGLSAAVRRDHAWTYVFGGLDPVHGPHALIEGARLFSHATDGVMPWRGRPEALKRGLVARTPPIDFSGED